MKIDSKIDPDDTDNRPEDMDDSRQDLKENEGSSRPGLPDENLKKADPESDEALYPKRVWNNKLYNPSVLKK